MNKIGIIGGVGPQATAFIYRLKSRRFSFTDNPKTKAQTVFSYVVV